MILDSLVSPAGAVTNVCYLYVISLSRNGNSANADATISATSGCATTVTGLGSTCSSFTRITANGTAPVGTVTLAASYSSATQAFSFTFSEASASCSIVGQGSTSGTTTSTPCSSTVAMTTVANLSSVTYSVPAFNINNVQAWAYIAVSC